MDYGKQMGHAVRLLSNLWKRELDNRTTLSGVDCLTGVQIGILEYINEVYDMGIEIYQKDIESTFKIRRSTVSVILRTMEEHGLIQRISVTGDARLKKIIPSQLALQNRDRTKDIVDGLADAMTEGIDEEDLKTFLRVANKMIDFLERCDKGYSDRQGSESEYNNGGTNE